MISLKVPGCEVDSLIIRVGLLRTFPSDSDAYWRSERSGAPELSNGVGTAITTTSQGSTMSYELDGLNMPADNALEIS